MPKRPGRGVDHPPPSSADVEEIVELYSTSTPHVCMACDRVNFTYLITIAIIDTSTATGPITGQTDENVLKIVTARYAVSWSRKVYKIAALAHINCVP